MCGYRKGFSIQHALLSLTEKWKKVLENKGYDLDLHNLIFKVRHDSVLAIEWFERNYIKLNQDKCHLLMSGHK